MTKTPAELNAEWERIAADLGDGIADTVEQAEADAVRKERAAVVAWLRAEAEAAAQTYTVQAGAWANRIDALATSIERGEHRREEGA
jgi:hypothetical protein